MTEELLVAMIESGPNILPNEHEQSMNQSISLSDDPPSQDSFFPTGRYK